MIRYFPRIVVNGCIYTPSNQHLSASEYFHTYEEALVWIRKVRGKGGKLFGNSLEIHYSIETVGVRDNSFRRTSIKFVSKKKPCPKYQLCVYYGPFNSNKEAEAFFKNFMLFHKPTGHFIYPSR